MPWVQVVDVYPQVHSFGFSSHFFLDFSRQEKKYRQRVAKFMLYDSLLVVLEGSLDIVD
jgi:hypothetical protein